MPQPPERVGIVIDRDLAKIVDPTPSGAGTSGHKARRLIDSSDAPFTDPFVLMGEDWMPHGAFAIHPHRGIETVTFVIEGIVEHFDNAGHRGVIQSGDAQWMTAGRGVLHEENALPGTIAHTIQLWVNLPAALKMTAPRYQDLHSEEVPTREVDGATVKVFSGEVEGLCAKTLNHVPILMVEIRLCQGSSTNLALPSADNAFLFVIEGSVGVGANGAGLSQGQIGWLTRSQQKGDSSITLRSADGACRVLLFAGPPLNEPVAYGGPFVMNTNEEIQQAFRDFAAGRF